MEGGSPDNRGDRLRLLPLRCGGGAFVALVIVLPLLLPPPPSPTVPSIVRDVVDRLRSIPPRPRDAILLLFLLHRHRRVREKRRAIPGWKTHVGIRDDIAENVRVHDKRAGTALRGIVDSGGVQGVRRSRHHERGSGRV